MNFINRYVLGCSFVVLILAVLYYMAAQYFGESGNNIGTNISGISYGVGIFITAVMFNKWDIYGGYMGFNYHLTGYIVCNGVPLVMAYAGLIDKEFIQVTYSVMISWGIGLLIHFIIFLFKRKRNIRGMDKKEVFE